MQEEKIYTADEIANELRISRRTVGRLCKRGDIPGAYKTGPATNSHWRIPQSGLDAYLKKIGKQKD